MDALGVQAPDTRDGTPKVVSHRREERDMTDLAQVEDLVWTAEPGCAELRGAHVHFGPATIGPGVPVWIADGAEIEVLVSAPVQIRGAISALTDSTIPTPAQIDLLESLITWVRTMADSN